VASQISGSEASGTGRVEGECVGCCGAGVRARLIEDVPSAGLKNTASWDYRE
jgi:hypothetical protein